MGRLASGLTITESSENHTFIFEDNSKLLCANHEFSQPHITAVEIIPHRPCMDPKIIGYRLLSASTATRNLCLELPPELLHQRFFCFIRVEFTSMRHMQSIEGVYTLY